MRSVFIVLLAVGCGSAKDDEPAGASSPSPAAYAVANAAALPTCDAASRGQLLYVEDEKRFVVCHASGWETIDLQGEAGKDGKDAAVVSMFAASIHCSGQLATTGVYATYDAAITKGGDVFANASVGNGTFDASNTQFYSKNQNGAATAMVTVVNDLQGPANAGWFSLELNRSTLVTTVIYHDVDAAGGQTVWTMTPDKCINNTYP